MSLIKVYYILRTQNDDGEYIEDNPDADYPNEVYVPPTWKSELVIEEISFKDIKLAFAQEDGDESFSKTILLIVNERDRVIYNPDNLKNAEDMVKRQEELIGQSKYDYDFLIRPCTKNPKIKDARYEYNPVNQKYMCSVCAELFTEEQLGELK